MKRSEKIGKKIIWVADSIVNFTVLVILLLLLALGSYAMWDSNQVYQEASASTYEMYKPTTDDSLSFEELQALNSDVFAWLSVYGTTIDYPVAQSTDNTKYLNRNIFGEYALAGSLFLDYQNARDFTDFNSIIYGHHMDKEVMFGGVDKFIDKTYFDERQYGNLFYGGKDHGVEFFAFLEADAYDGTLFSVALPENVRQQYLDNLLAKAKHTREIGVSIEDRIVLLYTCTSNTTNGRHILVGRITDEIHADVFQTDETVEKGRGVDGQTIWSFFRQIPIWIWGILWFVLLLLLLLLCQEKKKVRKHKGKEPYESESKDERS